MTSSSPGSRWSRTLWAAAGAIAGGAIGWLVGSYASCSQSTYGCELRVQAIEAAGTWVGGLGTMLAVWAAVAAFRGEERARLEANALEAERHSELVRAAAKDAELVTIRAEVAAHVGDSITQIRFLVTNNTPLTTAYHVTLSHDEYGPLLSAHSLGPGKSIAADVRFGMHSDRPNPVIASTDMRQWLRDQESRATLVFQLQGHLWDRKGTEFEEASSR